MDFLFANHGSICILTPLTTEACGWMQDNLPEDVQRWAGGTVIEPRYVQPIVSGILDAGFSIGDRS